MKTSIATVSIAGDLRDKLEAIAAAGFDGVEIFEMDFLTGEASARDVGVMARDLGLEITLFQPFRDFEGLPEPHRSRAFDRAERKFDLMGEMGAGLMLICSNVSPLALGGVDRAAADLAELGERAARRNLRVGYEALAWGRHVSDHRDAWEIVRRAGHPNIGLILDSFHTLARGIDVETIRAIPGDRIFIVQLADAPLIAMEPLYWSRHFRTMPGQGELNVTGFMRAVAATGYSGPLSLEIFNDQFRGATPRIIASDGRRSLLALVDDVARREPQAAMAPPAMPPRVAVSGVSFVEFADDEDEASRLAAMLRALGFRRTGRHIAKNVDLWRQGEARVVINREGEGFAHSSRLMHGMNVCAIGLAVADASAAVTRARALMAEPFEQPVGEGQLLIPAIRGLGGSVLHFIGADGPLNRVWEVEFTPVEDDRAVADAGILRVDHLAQTMSHEEMLTGQLFYGAIFDTVKTPVVDVVDPGGLIRSQAVESPDGRFRVTLNGAENRRTLAGHFIAERYGPAVQHIALACADIFDAADALAVNGFTPLPIPPNYYDDLAARFGLERDFLARLRRASILYDRDEAGEFFQIYGPVVGEGFFFEIVERRGGYRGYGAANAPFRIAAQRRYLAPKGMPTR